MSPCPCHGLHKVWRSYFMAETQSSDENIFSVQHIIYFWKFCLASIKDEPFQLFFIINVHSCHAVLQPQDSPIWKGWTEILFSPGFFGHWSTFSCISFQYFCFPVCLFFLLNFSGCSFHLGIFYWMLWGQCWDKELNVGTYWGTLEVVLYLYEGTLFLVIHPTENRKKTTLF